MRGPRCTLVRDSATCDPRSPDRVRQAPARRRDRAREAVSLSTGSEVALVDEALAKSIAKQRRYKLGLGNGECGSEAGRDPQSLAIALVVVKPDGQQASTRHETCLHDREDRVSLDAYAPLKQSHRVDRSAGWSKLAKQGVRVSCGCETLAAARRGGQHHASSNTTTCTPLLADMS